MSEATRKPGVDMKESYAAALRDIEEELAGLDERRSALQAAAAGMRRLIGNEQRPLPFVEIPRPSPTSSNGSSRWSIPPGLFAGKTATEAYRMLKQLYPGDYKAPEIADAFVAGGMEVKNRTALVQSIHSVLKRERWKREKERSGLGL
jgi:hypothetical protein